MSDFNFVEIDSKEIENKAINYYESYTGESLPVGDAKRHILQAVAYVATIMLNSINTTGKQNLLEYTFGTALDELGKLFNVSRLNEEYAKTTLEFTLSNAQATAVVIPKGTRVTAEGNIFFATDEDLTIASGATSGIVTATATAAGEVGNGFVKGQITKIVDGVPYVYSVTNTTDSTDGRNVETDNEYKERIRLSPFSYSTAGAKEAYNYLALSANPNVGDAETFQTDAGCVTVAIVKTDGTLPEANGEILKDVENAVNDKTARPLTDNVTVVAAKAINDTIDVTYYINSEDSTKAEIIKTEVKNAVDAYALWQTTKIGRGINPDRLRKEMYNAGAYKVEIAAPTETIVNKGEVAQFTDIKITYGGLKD